MATDLDAPSPLETAPFATNDPRWITCTVRTGPAWVETIIVGKTFQVWLDCSGNTSL
ncbi:hypothetical protein [Mycobacterium sp.]|uniref:hypothetical protein n=1 Tax=Mycobacterium sp. TaxID=1785 RepID=UPI003F9C7751